MHKHRKKSHPLEWLQEREKRGIPTHRTAALLLNKTEPMEPVIPEPSYTQCQLNIRTKEAFLKFSFISSYTDFTLKWQFFVKDYVMAIFFKFGIELIFYALRRKFYLRKKNRPVVILSTELTLKILILCHNLD